MTRRRPAEACARLLFALLVVLVAGCEAEATPLPAFIVASPTAPAATPTPGPLRYVLTSDSRYIADLPLLDAAADVVILDADTTPALGRDDAIIAGYGDRPGWTRSPVVPRVSFVIGASRPPLDQPEIAALIGASLDAPALVAAGSLAGGEPLADSPATPTTRAALASVGWPDGFDVALGHSGAPGAQAVAGQLAAVGVRATPLTLPQDALRPALHDGRINLALVIWTDDAERAAWADTFGADRILDLYTLPITFQAIDGLRLSFTPGGWPLASR